MKAVGHVHSSQWQTQDAFNLELFSHRRVVYSVFLYMKTYSKPHLYSEAAASGFSSAA
jgi:hypothetical protein